MAKSNNNNSTELSAVLHAECPPSLKERFTEAWKKTGEYASEAEVIRHLARNFIKSVEEMSSKKSPGQHEIREHAVLQTGEGYPEDDK